MAAKVNSQSRLLERDESYRQIFPGDIDLGAYLACARISKRIEMLMTGDIQDEDFDFYQGRGRKPSLWYTQWHVGMLLALDACGAESVSASTLSSVDVDEITDSRIRQIASKVNRYFNDARQKYGGPGKPKTVYQLTKSQALTEALLKEWDSFQ